MNFNREGAETVVFEIAMEDEYHLPIHRSMSISVYEGVGSISIVDNYEDITLQEKRGTPLSIRLVEGLVEVDLFEGWIKTLQSQVDEITIIE